MLNFVSKDPDVAHPEVFRKQFNDDAPLIIKKGWGIAIIVNALDGSTHLNPQGFAITINGRMRNTEIASTETTYIDAWSTLPDWSIFDYLTSLAFTIGVLPLAISSGAGAGSRHAIGTGVIGGMIVSTTIAIFFIPLFYSLSARLNAKFTKKGETNEA